MKATKTCKQSIYYDWVEKGEMPDPDKDLYREYPAIEEAARHLKLAGLLMASVMLELDQEDLFN